MEKKQYQKPQLKAVNLRITESVLTACKTAIKATQPGHSAKACNASPASGKCNLDVGS